MTQSSQQLLARSNRQWTQPPHSQERQPRSRQGIGGCAARLQTVAHARTTDTHCYRIPCTTTVPTTIHRRSTTTMVATFSEEKLNRVLGQALSDFGGTYHAALVVIGDELGLYKAMASDSPLTPAALAAKTGTAERYVREWLNANAAGGYVDYDAGHRPLQPLARAGDGPGRRAEPGLLRRRLPGCASRDARSCRSSPRPSAPARGRLARARPRRLPRHRAFLPPRLPGQPGGSGSPRSTGSRRSCRRARRWPMSAAGTAPPPIIMAQAYPNSRVRRLRLPRRVDRGRARSAPREAGVADRVRFEVAGAKDYPGRASTW